MISHGKSPILAVILLPASMLEPRRWTTVPPDTGPKTGLTLLRPGLTNLKSARLRARNSLATCEWQVFCDIIATSGHFIDQIFFLNFHECSKKYFEIVNEIICVFFCSNIWKGNERNIIPLIFLNISLSARRKIFILILKIRFFCQRLQRNRFNCRIIKF